MGLNLTVQYHTDSIRDGFYDLSSSRAATLTTILCCSERFGEEDRLYMYAVPGLST